MKYSILSPIIILSMFHITSAFPHIDQSGAGTLVFPVGARESGIGECGTALADDPSCLFYNPAGLGIISDHMNNGAISGFIEPILPSMKIKGQWHFGLPSIVWQDRAHYIGGLGFSVNHVNASREYTSTIVNGQFYSQSSYTPNGANILEAHGNRDKTIDSINGTTITTTGKLDETVTDISYGRDLLFNRNTKSSLALGISAKYVRSEVSDTDYNQVGRTFALDATMLAVLPLGFRIGGGFYNIGPKISYNGTGPMGSYPIPFSVRLGFAWKHEVVVSGIRLFCPVSTIEMNREITRNNAGRQPDNFIRAIYDDLISDTLENRRDELQKFILHRGAELNIMNTVSVRVGGLIGAAEDRYEIHEGLGVNVLNHIAMDYVRIFSTNNRPRNGQWSINVNLFNLVKWSKNDFCWWRKV